MTIINFIPDLFLHQGQVHIANTINLRDATIINRVAMVTGSMILIFTLIQLSSNEREARVRFDDRL